MFQPNKSVCSGKITPGTLSRTIATSEASSTYRALASEAGALAKIGAHGSHNIILRTDSILAGGLVHNRR